MQTSNAEKLYFLMVCVNKPASFDILRAGARFCGIDFEELSQILVENPKFFYEIKDQIWTTRLDAESSGLLSCTELPHANTCPTAQPKSSSIALHIDPNRRPIKNGISCHSAEEITERANTFIQSKEFKCKRLHNLDMLEAFLNQLNRPVRAADLNNAVFNILRLSLSASTLRKYLNSHRDIFCSPTHGAWCTQDLAKELGLEDYRQPNS